MKAKIFYILMFILIVLFGCDRKEEASKESEIEILEKPETTYLTETQIKDYVDKEINLAIDLGNENFIQEAADVISLTRSCISSILEKDYADAIETINRAIAKAELITMSDHDTKIVSEVNIEVVNNVKDAETAVHLIHKVDSLMESGELQKAKKSMMQLTSELSITRESISISSYLQTLRDADQFMKNKQYEKALLKLNSILGNIIIERSVTPLPLIIAQKMIIEMEELMSKEQPDKESIQILLNNAEYQVRLSELLGYGRTNEGYKKVFNEITEIRNNIEDDKYEIAKNLARDLNGDLDRLQDDISLYKPVDAEAV